MRPQPLHQQPPKLLRRLPLPLTRNVLGNCVDGSLDPGADLSPAILGEFGHELHLVRCGRSTSFGSADQVVD